MHLGAHVPTTAGLRDSLDRPLRMGLKSVQVSTRSATRWFTPPLDPEDVVGFREKAERFERGNLFALASPLINLASPDDATHRRSLEALYDEFIRAEALGLSWIVLSPGNHETRGEEWGLRQVIQSLNRSLDRTRGFRCGVLLETSAGEDGALGAQFEQLGRIRRRVTDTKRIGVCIDTARIFAAGYDLRDPEAYARTLVEVNRHLDTKFVRGFHLCDSVHPLGSRKPQAASIGEGEIGVEAISRLLNDPCWASVPGILELPRRPSRAFDFEDFNRLRSLVLDDSRRQN